MWEDASSPRGLLLRSPRHRQASCLLGPSEVSLSFECELTAPSWGRSTKGDVEDPGGAGELPEGRGAGPAPAVTQKTRERAQCDSMAAAAEGPDAAPPPGDAILRETGESQGKEESGKK